MTIAVNYLTYRKNRLKKKKKHLESQFVNLFPKVKFVYGCAMDGFRKAAFYRTRVHVHIIFPTSVPIGVVTQV